jgi:hypothetical protein
MGKEPPSARAINRAEPTPKAGKLQDGKRRKTGVVRQAKPDNKSLEYYRIILKTPLLDLQPRAALFAMPDT